MSTARLFKSLTPSALVDDLDRIERQRDRLQLRNAELVLILQEVQRWLNRSAFRGPKIDGIRKRIDEALKCPAS